MLEFSFTSGGHLDVHRNTAHSLVLKRSVMGAFIDGTILILIIAAFFFFSDDPEDINPSFRWLLLAAIVVTSAPSIYASFYAVFIGETYKFQKVRQRIYKNKRKWFNFVEIKQVLICHEYDSEDDRFSYDLYLVSTGQHKFQLDSSGDLEVIQFIAQEIAEVLQLKVSNQFN